MALYFRAWGEARKVLRSKLIPPDEADAKRHQIHREVLGKDKSAKDLTNTEFDRVLAAFRAVSTPVEDLYGQLAADRVGIEQLRKSVRLLCSALERGDDYLEGIARQMNSGGRISQPMAEDRANFDYAHTKGGEVARKTLIFDELIEAELLKIQIALKLQCRRVWKTKPDMLQAINDLVRENELDPQETADTAREGLGWSKLPALEGMKYDHLVLVLGAIRPLVSSDKPF